MKRSEADHRVPELPNRRENNLQWADFLELTYFVGGEPRGHEVNPRDRSFIVKASLIHL